MVWPFSMNRNRADSGGAIPRDPSDDRWYSVGGRMSIAGVEVTVDRARKVPVVRDCLQVLATSIGGLSHGIFRRVDADKREWVDHHPAALLLNNPNPRDTSYDFITNMVDDLASEGRFLAERVQAPRGEQLWRIEPQHFTVEALPDRGTRFKVREPGRAERTLLDDEVWYIPLPPVRDYVHGRSPILDDGTETIGAALGLLQYANSFFANDATPPLIFKHKGNFTDDASKKNFLAAWAKWAGGKRRHKPAVLEYGMEAVQLAHNNEQAQFLETRKELWLDVTRLWRIPPHKVGILDRATHSNIEHQGLEFVTDTLLPWLKLIETSFHKTFIADAAYIFEFNVASLLRGDLKARYEAYAIGRQWGWLSVNAICRLERMNGIGPAGDRYIEPMNMTAVGAPASNRDGTQKAIEFLRQSVAENGGRPHLKVIHNAA